MAASGPTDRITLTGLRARGFHGVFPHEREQGQTFLVDVVLTVDTGPAAASDELADTVDYGAIADAIVAQVEGEPRNLIESLADRIAQSCLEHAGVHRVEVTVHKPDAPITAHFEDVAVTVVRTR
jgi:dihydroneopterin aldolase